MFAKVAKYSKYFRIIGASLNAVLMLFFAFYLLSLPYVHGDDMLLIEYGAKIKNILFGLQEKPPRKDFMFVNVAYDRQLTNKLDTNGFPMGKEAIVDRKKLTRFFDILGKNPKNQKYIICDIHFADSSSVNVCQNANQNNSISDTISPDFGLAKALQKLPNIILSYHLDEKGKPENPIFKNIPKGLSDYTTTGDVFLKFKLLHHDSIKTTPLLMYEYLHQKKLEKGTFLHQLNDKNIFNTFIVDFRIRNYDLFVAKEPYKVDNLENMLSGAMNETDILAYVKDRIIIIGDFSLYDNHKTIYGQTAGSLILLNTYLALVEADNKVSFGLILFLYICFWLASWIAFSPENWFEEHIKNASLKRIVSFLSYVFILIISSLACYFIFAMSLSILYLSFYLFVMRFLVNYFSNKQ